ncbi:MAG TPA: aminotransferase class V-fold PLP-dependent enzyme [Candidatus Dormibacteraeota bacterium]|nr:aminotransferase class V-fold PLP-dependent enzyme [Candidatus Dormibacteraeota bacterium]
MGDIALSDLTPIVAPGDFPASRRSVYLNTASVCLMYSGAERAVVEWTHDLAENGTIHFDEAAEERAFATLHASAARLFNCRPEEIAVGSSATELLASLAWAVAPPAGSNIVSTGLEFPSTVYPWARVARHTGAEVRLAGMKGDCPLADDLIGLIDRGTVVVCVSDVIYSTGRRLDVAALAEAAHRNGALLVIDATQSAGGIPIDVGALGADALITASYKWLCGPFGVAVMYLAPHLHERLEPGLVGFRSHERMWDLRADRLKLPPNAHRFEFSTMAYGCAPGLASSIDYLLQLDVGRIFSRNKRLADLLIEGLRERKAEILSPTDDGARSSIVATRFAGTDVRILAERLNEARIVVSARRNVLRFSPHLYNDADDIQQALTAIDRCLT